MSYADWRKRHPHAAAELEAELGAIQRAGPGDEVVGKSEAWAQQQVRFKVARAGGMAWRNNVGANKTKEHTACPRCSFQYIIERPPLRWGLGNDSMKLNRIIKSSDLICALPLVITPQDVGRTIAQFGSFEVKKPGWSFNPNDEHQQAQLKWLQLIESIGGRAQFTTGEICL